MLESGSCIPDGMYEWQKSVSAAMLREAVDYIFEGKQLCDITAVAPHTARGWLAPVGLSSAEIAGPC